MATIVKLIIIAIMLAHFSSYPPVIVCCCTVLINIFTFALIFLRQDRNYPSCWELEVHPPCLGEMQEKPIFLWSSVPTNILLLARPWPPAAVAAAINKVSSVWMGKNNNKLVFCFYAFLDKMMWKHRINSTGESMIIDNKILKSNRQ